MSNREAQLANCFKSMGWNYSHIKVSLDPETIKDLQHIVDTDQSDFKELIFGCDKLSTMIRRTVKRFSDEETELFS